MLKIGLVRRVGQLSMQNSDAPHMILEAFQKAGKIDMAIYCKKELCPAPLCNAPLCKIDRTIADIVQLVPMSAMECTEVL